MADILTLTMNPAIDVAMSSEAAHKIRCTGVQRDPGGGGINVARVIMQLGVTCQTLYPADGPLGAFLQRLTDREGLDSRCIEIAGDTRESFTVQDASKGVEYRFVLPGPELAEHEWQAMLDSQENLDEPAGYIVASGSLPAGVPDDFYAQVAAIARAKNARFVLDTSGPPLTAALKAGVFMVKPNLRELEELTGKKLVSEAAWTMPVK